MSRVRIFLCCLLCAATWFLPASAETLRGYDKTEGYQHVFLGRYPQQEDGRVEPILWRVLGVKENEALLLSEAVLFNHRVHEDYLEYEGFEGQFNLTEIFGLLNSTFLNTAFTEKEQALLVTDEELGTVFLVTADDLKNKAYGFITNASRQAFGTPYALANGLYHYGHDRIGRLSSPYWTRTRSTTLKSGVRCTKVDGSVGYIRCVVMNEGIRPAIRLRLQNGTLSNWAGTGTKDSPFIINEAGLDP